MSELIPCPLEEWKDIKDFESLYQISNYGRVRRLGVHRISTRYYKKGKYYPTQIMTSSTSKRGYCCTQLFDYKGSLDNKIKGAKTFNMMNDIKTYEKQLIAKLKEAGLKITGSNPASYDKRLTEYDVEINYKDETEEGYVCLYVDDGELWVNYELFSGMSGNDPYEEFINDTLPLEIKDFKKYVG